MSKPKKWDTMTIDEQEEWKEKRRLAHQNWVENNKERFKELLKKWNANNKPKLKEKQRKRYAKDPEKYKAIRRQYYAENKDKQRAQMRKYTRKFRLENPTRSAEINKKSREKNPEVYRAIGRRPAINLTDGYILSLLKIRAKVGRKYPSIIEAKRDQIKILRELKPTTRKKKQDAQEPEQPARSPR